LQPAKREIDRNGYVIDPAILSIYQLAERYDVTPATINRWRATGKLPQGFLHRARRFWLVSEIEEMESHE